MYCPSCGIRASTGQKFCRSCGMRLQVISRIPTKQDDQIDFVYSGETKLERWTNNIGCLSGIIILLMVAIHVIVRLIGNIIGVKIEGQGFDVFWERGMGVGFLLLLIGILLKIYIKTKYRTKAYKAY
jgi:hypothetical protein